MAVEADLHLARRRPRCECRHVLIPGHRYRGARMNAVVDDQARPRKSRHLEDARGRSALECELEEWGKWIEDHSDYEGYPRADAVQAWIEGFGGGRSGHKVL